MTTIPTDRPAHTNRLALETSPYLLQHQHNPVDWYAWGPEAFQAARTQDKPIFLSVGYSTCYWCHVMERQSFENPAIAQVMNDLFVNIKVDREERPDVDQLYMTAVQVLTRHGGWPMSVFLTPDLKPFYGGTYFPPEDHYGRPGFPKLLRDVENAYRSRRDDVSKSADQLVNILRQLAEPSPPTAAMSIDEAFIDELVLRSLADYDQTHGGFGSAPKFPRQTLLELLLHYTSTLTGNLSLTKSTETGLILKILQRVRHTLDAMADGGIRDHLGGGFHRYSTDAKWLVPHFEIMLYDNAMLAWCYVEAYRQTEEPRYAHVARGICDFVLREMTSPDGAFYTAFDAEVDAMEGKSYLWTAEQIGQVLGKEDAAVFMEVYGVSRGPNFADPHHGSGVPDQNILYLPDGPAREQDEHVAAMRQKLLEARKLRKQPLLDTKVITSWNGLMIRALAYAGQVLAEQRYIAAASRAANVLLAHHQQDDGTLYRTSRDGAKKYAGFLDDYANLAQACLALHDAGADERWKAAAEAIALVMLRKFGSDEGGATSAGGFYFTDRDATDLIVRQKTATDSPLPSGNAVATMVLLRLGRREEAAGTIAAFAEQLQGNGESMSALVQAALLHFRQFGALTVQGGAARDDAPPSPQQLADRVVAVMTAWRSPQALEVRLKILQGFHINAHETSPGLVPTELSVGDDVASLVSGIEFPTGTEQTLPYAGGPLRVYEGQTTITVHFHSPPLMPLLLGLRYQACDQSACLAVASKAIEVPAPTPA